MAIGYLMNTYPMVSTTFIGREIAALEQHGLVVHRYAIRPWAETLVDPQDLAEAAGTHYLLGDSLRLVKGLLREPFRSPRRFLAAVRLTWRLARNARGRMGKHVGYLAEAIVLRDMAVRDRLTHIHAHFSTNSTAVAMLARELGGPEYSFTVHGPDELLTPVENSTAEKVARARFVVCISQYARSQVMLFSDQAHWDKLAIVHCGIDPAKYGRKPRGSYGKHIVFVGRLAAVKGVPILLGGIALARQAHPELRVTIIGDGPDRARLEAQAEDLGLTGAFAFVGYQSQAAVGEVLDAADMLVLPSFAEGVPVVLMEAMASRLPVVTTQIAGIPELVEHGVSGLLVAPGSAEALATALTTLMSNPERSATMGEQGRAKVVAEFSSEAEARKLLALIEAD